MGRMTELERFIAPLRFFKLCKNQSFETNTFTQRFIFTLGGEPLDLVGGGVTSTKHVFFSGEFAVHDFFWIYDVCRIFFKHNFRTILCI